MSKKLPITVGSRVRLKDSGANGALGTVRNPHIHQVTQRGGATPAERLIWIKNPKERPGQDFFDMGWVSVAWDDEENLEDGYFPESLEVVEGPDKTRLRDWSK